VLGAVTMMGAPLKDMTLLAGLWPRSFRGLFRLAAFIAVAAATSSLLTSAAQKPASNRYVALISLDGFAAYALADPTVPAPNLRALAKEGARADALIPVNPTVTWPNHTSMVTGVTPARHGVLYNGLPVRTGEGPIKVEPHIEKSTLVRGRTVYDAAREAGLTTAEVDWVAIERAPTITWSFSEFANVDGQVEREMVAAGRLTADEARGFTKLPITMRDEIWARAAEHIVTRHRPNLLLLHFLTTDSTQHRYGARSLGGNTALALADSLVGRVVAAYRAAGIFDRTTFVVVSDHGFKSYKRVIHPNAAIARQGMKGAWVVPEGGTAMVYVTAAGDKSATLGALTGLFQGIEGIARVLSGPDAVALGYPDAAREERMADLVLAASEGYAFDAAATGDAVTDVASGATPGAHGYLNTDPDMHAIFIASGAGVKRDAALKSVRTIDIAPTIAHWLSLKLPDVDGRVLTELVP
jgi:predicted AlkP superfamily pyrophosphatase or phosphodiesterase